MRCARLYEALKTISEGNEPGAGMGEELVGMGLAARAARPAAPGELDRLKGELLAVRQELEKLAATAMAQDALETGLTDEEIRDRSRQARKREAELRRAIILLVGSGGAAPAGGASVTLTYKGREALQTIGARLPAANDMDWSELGAGVERLRAKLASEAAESAAILKEISGLLKPEEQHLLRSAAVGLASVPGAPLEKAQQFCGLMRQFGKTFVDDQYATVGAEIALAQAAGNMGAATEHAAEMAAIASKLFRDPELGRDEYLSLPVLLMSLPKGEREPALEAARQDGKAFGSAFAPVFLRLGSPDTLESGERNRLFLFWTDILARGERPAPVDAVVAAALLATARGDREAIEGRFREASEFMASLFEERMYTPSAVIALWPGGIEESLDNIRMAASEILQFRLSLGGMENFALGMKLLANNAQFAMLGAAGPPEWMRAPGAGRERPSLTAVAVATASAAAAAGAVMLATPLLARAPFTLFHSLTLQRAAIQQVTYHSVHSHYLYG